MNLGSTDMLSPPKAETTLVTNKGDSVLLCLFCVVKEGKKKEK